MSIVQMLTLVFSFLPLPFNKTFSTIILRFMLLGLLGLGFSSSPLQAQQKQITQSNQQWFHYYTQLPLNGKWTFRADFGYRWREGFEQRSQYIIRSGIAYAFSTKMRLTLGLAQLGFYNSEAEINRLELRPYQEFSLRSFHNKVWIGHRYRLEERIFYPVENGNAQAAQALVFRFRYRFLLGIPLFALSAKSDAPSVSLEVGDEILLSAGRDIVHNVFNQNRILVSPVLKLSPDLKIAFTYHGMLASTRELGQFQFRHIFWLQVKQKLVRKKPS